MLDYAEVLPQTTSQCCKGCGFRAEPTAGSTDTAVFKEYKFTPLKSPRRKSTNSTDEKSPRKSFICTECQKLPYTKLVAKMQEQRLKEWAHNDLVKAEKVAAENKKRWKTNAEKQPWNSPRQPSPPSVEKWNSSTLTSKAKSKPSWGYPSPKLTDKRQVKSPSMSRRQSEDRRSDDKLNKSIESPHTQTAPLTPNPRRRTSKDMVYRTAPTGVVTMAARRNTSKNTTDKRATWRPAGPGGNKSFSMIVTPLPSKGKISCGLKAKKTKEKQVITCKESPASRVNVRYTAAGAPAGAPASSRASVAADDDSDSYSVMVPHKPPLSPQRSRGAQPGALASPRQQKITSRVSSYRKPASSPRSESAAGNTQRKSGSKPDGPKKLTSSGESDKAILDRKRKYSPGNTNHNQTDLCDDYLDMTGTGSHGLSHSRSFEIDFSRDGSVAMQFVRDTKSDLYDLYSRMSALDQDETEEAEVGEGWEDVQLSEQQQQPENSLDKTDNDSGMEFVESAEAEVLSTEQQQESDNQNNNNNSRESGGKIRMPFHDLPYFYARDYVYSLDRVMPFTRKFKPSKAKPGFRNNMKSKQRSVSQSVDKKRKSSPVKPTVKPRSGGKKTGVKTGQEEREIYQVDSLDSLDDGLSSLLDSVEMKALLKTMRTDSLRADKLDEAKPDVGNNAKTGHLQVKMGTKSLKGKLPETITPRSKSGGSTAMNKSKAKVTRANERSPREKRLSVSSKATEKFREKSEHKVRVRKKGVANMTPSPEAVKREKSTYSKKSSGWKEASSAAKRKSPIKTYRSGPYSYFGSGSEGRKKGNHLACEYIRNPYSASISDLPGTVSNPLFLDIQPIQHTISAPTSPQGRKKRASSKKLETPPSAPVKKSNMKKPTTKAAGKPKKSPEKRSSVKAKGLPTSSKKARGYSSPRKHTSENGARNGKHKVQRKSVKESSDTTQQRMKEEIVATSQKEVVASGEFERSPEITGSSASLEEQYINIKRNLNDIYQHSLGLSRKECQKLLQNKDFTSGLKNISKLLKTQHQTHAGEAEYENVLGHGADGGSDMNGSHDYVNMAAQQSGAAGALEHVYENIVNPLNEDCIIVEEGVRDGKEVTLCVVNFSDTDMDERLREKYGEMIAMDQLTTLANKAHEKLLAELDDKKQLMLRGLSTDKDFDQPRFDFCGLDSTKRNAVPVISQELLETVSEDSYILPGIQKPHSSDLIVFDTQLTGEMNPGLNQPDQPVSFNQTVVEAKQDSLCYQVKAGPLGNERELDGKPSTAAVGTGIFHLKPEDEKIGGTDFYKICDKKLSQHEAAMKFAMSDSASDTKASTSGKTKKGLKKREKSSSAPKINKKSQQHVCDDGNRRDKSVTLVEDGLQNMNGNNNITNKRRCKAPVQKISEEKMDVDVDEADACSDLEMKTVVASRLADNPSNTPASPRNILRTPQFGRVKSSLPWGSNSTPTSPRMGSPYAGSSPVVSSPSQERMSNSFTAGTPPIKRLTDADLTPLLNTEVDAITTVHTKCNSHYTAMITDKPSMSDICRTRDVPKKSQTHVRFPDNPTDAILSEVTAGMAADTAGITADVTAVKDDSESMETSSCKPSILKKQPSEMSRRYMDEPKANVWIMKRSCKPRVSTISFATID